MVKLWEKYFSMYDIENIDFDKIANKYEISGGSMLNVLRYCAIQATNRTSGKVLEKDVIDAIKKEYDKEGQTI
jgi:ATP-dependent 26S proteasome regulatory subunit